MLWGRRRGEWIGRRVEEDRIRGGENEGGGEWNERRVDGKESRGGGE